jgi:uncharacterized lipoprotein YajG
MKQLTFLITTMLLLACNNQNNSQNKNQSETLKSDASTFEQTDNNAINEKEQEEEINISGVYTGTDNLGLESSIIIQNDGTLMVQSSIGDGTPSYGFWVGDANNLSLYQRDQMGNRQLIGRAKIDERGLKIIGGQFYTRQ